MSTQSLTAHRQCEDQSEKERTCQQLIYRCYEKEVAKASYLWLPLMISLKNCFPLFFIFFKCTKSINKYPQSRETGRHQRVIKYMQQCHQARTNNRQVHRPRAKLDRPPVLARLRPHNFVNLATLTFMLLVDSGVPMHIKYPIILAIIHVGIRNTSLAYYRISGARCSAAFRVH